MITPELYGLVLIGGESRRMGIDKSLLSYHSKDQRTHSFELLSTYCKKVFLSCNKNQTGEITLPCIVDLNNYHGPLAGLLSAHEKFPDVSWLVLACDMPFVDKKVLEVLISHRNAGTMATCFYKDRPEPLCSIWEPSAFVALKKFLKKEKPSPLFFLQTHEVQYIHVDETFTKNLISINTPEERKRL